MADEDQIKYTTFTGEDRKRENWKKQYEGSLSSSDYNAPKNTPTWTSRGFRKTKGSTILNIINTDTTQKLPTTWKSELNPSFDIDIDPNTIYWWNDKKIGAMADLDAEKSLIANLQGGSSLGAAKVNDPNVFDSEIDVDYVSSKYNIPKQALNYVINTGSKLLDPLGEAAELMAIKFGIPGAKTLPVAEFKGLLLGALGSAVASTFVYNSEKFGTEEALGAFSSGVFGVPPSKPATEMKDFTPEEEYGAIADSLLTGMEFFINIVNHMPFTRLTMEAEEKVFNDEDGYFGFMGDKLKSAIGAFK